MIYSAYIIEIWNNISYYELHVLFTDLFPEQYQNNIIQVETAICYVGYKMTDGVEKIKKFFSYIYRDACIYFSKKKGRNKVNNLSYNLKQIRTMFSNNGMLMLNIWI